MEKFVDSLRLFCEQYKPRTLLYVGKVFGEYYPTSLPSIDTIKVTNLFIREPLLQNQEEKELPGLPSRVCGSFCFCETFEEALTKIREFPGPFDLILMDTVHFQEYVTVLLDTMVKISLAPYLVLHDAMPAFDKWCIPERHHGCMPWCGTTHVAIYHFLQQYPGTTHIVRDDHAGYAFIRWTVPLPISHTPCPSENITLQDVRNKSISHESFFQDILSPRLWVEAPAPSHYPVREKVQCLRVQPGIVYHVFWKDFSATENRRGPSLSLFVHGEERLKFDFQGDDGHFHRIDEKGVDSGRLPFSSTEIEDQLKEMKTLLQEYVVPGEKVLDEACRRLQNFWSS